MLCLLRATSIDIKYQIWKFGVVFTDGVSESKIYLYIKYYTRNNTNILNYTVSTREHNKIMIKDSNESNNRFFFMNCSGLFKKQQQK